VRFTKNQIVDSSQRGSLGWNAKLYDFSDVTVLIFSRNREKELIALTQYLLLSNIKILILDGTVNGYKSELLKHRRITLIKAETFAERSERAVGKIATKYSMFLADDDLISWAGLHEAQLVLEKRHDVACVYSVRSFTDYYIERRIDFEAMELDS
jgi:hypothetical protein